ncbi:DgyrCDS2950 [Dimorphilus gyrociliatus]|uniref:DgyrCDS2950 n=1 Tax=Dimorphilus gyrociliatus TaxID=2664684 RepID=A0A7I8VEH1_9ANNE|nr:DgyrCDS2950 [Dimorphilus gyrociliatus]
MTPDRVSIESSSCFYRNGTSNTTLSCPDGYAYDADSGYDSTIVTEFNLVCDKKLLPEIFLSAGTLGGVVGSLFINRLSDVIGRKKLLTIVLFVGFVRNMVSALSPTFLFLIVWECIMSITFYGLATTIMICVLEIFPKERRTFAGTAIEFFWCGGYFLAALIVYLIRNWRLLTCYSGAIQLFSAALIHFGTPESINWLLANGKFDEAENVIQMASKYNTKEVTKEDFNQIYEAKNVKVENEAQSKISLLSIFSNKTVLKCINMLVYSGLNLTVTNLTGDRYLNFLLYATAEVPAFIVMYFILPVWGRRIPCAVFHVIAGLSLIMTIIPNLNLLSETQAYIFGLTMNFIGKFGITASFSIIYLQIPEIFPTNIRNFSMGLCMFSSRALSLAIPFARTLDKEIPWLVRALFGGLSVLGAFAALNVPETLGRDLPRDMEELNSWSLKGPKYDKQGKDEHVYLEMNKSSQ